STDRIVMPVLRELVEETGESAAYHIAHGNQRLCLYRVDSPHPIRDHIKAGDVLPLDRGSGGKVLMAFAARRSETNSPEAQALYEQIRRNGYYGGVGDRLDG